MIRSIHSPAPLSVSTIFQSIRQTNITRIRVNHTDKVDQPYPDACLFFDEYEVTISSAMVTFSRMFWHSLTFQSLLHNKICTPVLCFVTRDTYSTLITISQFVHSRNKVSGCISKVQRYLIETALLHLVTSQSYD